MTDEQYDIPEKYMKEWQNIVDILASVMDIPAGLIMRIVKSEIEVFISSRSEGNPYKPGDNEELYGSGLYCETVIKSNEKLLVPDALSDEDWKDNPDVKLNMISYLGFPIVYPDGTPFGTICVLDNKNNSYSNTYESLMIKFRDIVQNQLELIHMNKTLGDENKKLSDYLSEIKNLREIIPICASCKNIRDDEGFWHQVETYFTHHTGSKFTHGICPVCIKEHYPEINKQLDARKDK